MRNRNDYSVKKRLAVGIGGFCLVAAGAYCTGKKMANNRKQQIAPSLSSEEKEKLLPPEISIPQENKEEAKTEDTSYLPWWTGVKEISILDNIYS